MAGGWLKLEVDDWPSFATHFDGKTWPEYAIRMDLRWHLNESWMSKPRDAKGKATGKPRVRVPNDRAFAARWGMSRRQAAKRMADTDWWVDPKAGWAGDAKRSETDPEPNPKRSESEPEQNGQTSKVSKNRSESEPEAIRERAESGDTRGGELEQEQEQEPLLSPQANDASKEPAGWAEVMVDWNVYAKARGDRGKSRIKPKGTLKTEGGSLVWLLKKLGKERLCEMLQWLATDQTPNSRAMYYRREGLGAINMRPNYVDLLRLMDRSKNGQRANTAPANASDTPGHMFMRAYRNARGQHPAWLDHVPSDEREHFENAARRCGAFNMVRTMSTHPVAERETIKTFNDAFEATR